MKPRLRTLFPAPVRALDGSTLSGPGAPVVFSILAFLLLLLVLSAGWRTIDSSEILMHLKAGEPIAASRVAPKADVFSAASDPKGWTYIEWGWAGILAAAYGAGKWNALSWLNVALMAATAGLLLVRARRRGARWFESLVTSAFVMAALIPGAQPGPGRAALVLFLLALLIGEARRLWPLIFLPIVSLLWANIYPAFLLVALVPIARIILPPRDENGDKAPGPTAYLLVIIMTCLAAALINPYSIRILSAAFDTLVFYLNETLHHPAETFGDAGVIVQIIATVALVTAAGLSRRGIQNWEILAAAFLLAGTIVSPVSLTFLTIYLAAPAAAALSGTLVTTWHTRVVRHAAGAAFLLAILALGSGSVALAHLSKDAFGARLRPDVFPETAAGRLASLPLRNAILNGTRDGGYLAWRLWPSWKITMDERPTLYSRELRQQYALLWQGGQGWDEMLNLWRVNAVLGRPETMVEHPRSNLFIRLAESPDWKAVYWDSSSILYVKSDLNLAKTNLQEYRQLKPGLSWAELESRTESPKQWRELAADLRRAVMEDPDNTLAREFLRLAEQRN